MDEPNRSPPAADISASDSPAAARRDPQDTSVVYCGSPARVREGFAIALGLMGIPTTTAAVRGTSRPNQDDDHA